MNDFPFQTNKITETLANYNLQSLKSICDLLAREVNVLSNVITENPAISNVENKISLAHEVERFELNLIKNALACSNGNQTKAANLLGLKLTTLNAKIKRFRIKISL